MNSSRLAKLAAAGITGASLFTLNAVANNVSADNSVLITADDEVVHNCAGLNECKGLGGCKVTKTKLEMLAKKKGISVSEAGKPHSCAGKNECKGLGGCKVTKKKLEMLKKKQKMKE